MKKIEYGSGNANTGYTFVIALAWIAFSIIVLNEINKGRSWQDIRVLVTVAALVNCLVTGYSGYMMYIFKKFIISSISIQVETDDLKRDLSNLHEVMGGKLLFCITKHVQREINITDICSFTLVKWFPGIRAFPVIIKLIDGEWYRFSLYEAKEIVLILKKRNPNIYVDPETFKLTES